MTVCTLRSLAVLVRVATSVVLQSDGNHHQSEAATKAPAVIEELCIGSPDSNPVHHPPMGLKKIVLAHILMMRHSK